MTAKRLMIKDPGMSKTTRTLKIVRSLNMKVLKGYTDKIRLLTLPVLPLLMSLALMMMVVVGVNTTAVVANAQCSVYTFNGITGQLDCVTASGVNVITFATDGNERMRITQGGNVLVGTTTDDGVNLFQVDGSGAFATSVQTPIWNDVTLASGIFSRAGTLGLSATGANAVTIATNGTTRVTVASDGRFTATGDLFVTGGRYIQTISADTTTITELFSTNGVAYFGTQSAHPLRFRTTDIDRMVLTTGGNLLIGTTTDDTVSKLQVAGSATNYGMTVYNPTATTGVTSLVVRAGAGQSTTALQTWQDNAGTAMSSISYLGEFRLQDNTTNYMVAENRTGGTDNGNYGLYMNHTAESIALYAGSTETFTVKKSKIGFFGVTPVARAAALTAADAGALNTGDAGSDTVIANMRTRIGELETKLQAYGLLN